MSNKTLPLPTVVLGPPIAPSVGDIVTGPNGKPCRVLSVDEETGAILAIDIRFVAEWAVPLPPIPS